MPGEKPIDETVEKIAKECEEASASKWCIVKIIKELDALETKDIEKMRSKALEILKETDPKAAEVFSSFQRMTVRTSAQHIEAFDRGNIIKSLLKETSIAHGVAEKIGREVEDKIKDLRVSYITTVLIREIVNVKLLEYGHENIRNQYARAGLPVFEVEKKILKMPYSNRAIMTEFNLLKIIPKELSDLHLSSDIFIANIEDFCTKPIACCISIEKQKSLKKTIFECAKKANAMQDFFSWGVNISEANVAISALIERKSAEDAGELFAGAMACIKPKKPFGNIGLNLFVPETTGFEVDNETLIVLANKMLEKIMQNSINAKPVFLIDTKYKLALLPEKQRRKTSFVNCKKNYLLPINGIAAEKGISCFIGLNLPKQAFNSTPEKFSEKTLAIIERIRQLAELKKAELEKREYFKKAGIETGKMRPALGLFSIISACRQAMPKASQKKVLDFSAKTVEKIRAALGEDWIIAELENKKGIERFEAENRRLQILDAKQDEWTQLLKAKIHGLVFFQAEAKNTPLFNKLMDENIAWINFKP